MEHEFEIGDLVWWRGISTESYQKVWFSGTVISIRITEDPDSVVVYHTAGPYVDKVWQHGGAALYKSPDAAGIADHRQRQGEREANDPVVLAVTVPNKLQRILADLAADSKMDLDVFIVKELEWAVRMHHKGRNY